SSEEPVMIAVSGTGRGIASIRELYRQAAEVARAKRGQGRTGLFYFCGDYKGQVNYEALKAKLDQLFAAVLAGDETNIGASVKEFIASFVCRVPDIEAAKAYVVNLECLICERIAELGGDPNTLMGTVQEKCGLLGEQADYCRLERYVEQLC